MIDRDTLRTARRTVERNGFTVLPPRDRDERDLNRFRTRRDVENEDRDSRPTRPAPRFRDTVEQDEPRRFKPLRQRVYDDDYDERRPARPVRREMNDDEKLGAAIRTAEENGFTIRKMSKLDQAKQVARDNGFDVRKVDSEDRTARTVPGRAQRPLVRPKANPSVNDGIRTRTAPDTEIKNNTQTQTQTETPEDTKKTYADDFMDRAARFFGEEE
jgi:hypothetical protein